MNYSNVSICEIIKLRIYVPEKRINPRNCHWNCRHTRRINGEIMHLPIGSKICAEQRDTHNQWLHMCLGEKSFTAWLRSTRRTGHHMSLLVSLHCGCDGESHKSDWHRTNGKYILTEWRIFLISLSGSPTKSCLKISMDCTLRCHFSHGSVIDCAISAADVHVSRHNT
jgi:hypothetical protein